MTLIREEAFLLGPYKSLVGVYSPAYSADAVTVADKKIAVILLNAGLIHHVGPHRLHVDLARVLAVNGISTLRVDLSGIGDSCVRPDSIPASELAARELKEIMDDMEKQDHEGFIIFGICSGAKNAMLAAQEDPRIRGLVLVNSAGYDDAEAESQAAIQYYMHRSLRNPRAWLNLLTGKVDYKKLFLSIAGVFVNRRTSNSSKSSMLDSIREILRPVLEQGTHLLVIISDRQAQYMMLHEDVVQGLQQNKLIQMEVRPNADHLFSTLADRKWLIERVCNWARQIKLESSLVSIKKAQVFSAD